MKKALSIRISWFFAINLLFIAQAQAGQDLVTIKVPPELANMLKTLHTCSDTQILSEFDQALERGRKAFFQDINPESAWTHIQRALKLWQDNECTFIAKQQMNKVAKAYILGVRVLVLSKHLSKARALALEAISKLGKHPFSAGSIPPDVSRLFNGPVPDRKALKLMPYNNKMRGCVAFIDGITVTNAADIVPGQHEIFVKCGGQITWRERLIVDRDTSVRLLVDLPAFVQKVTKGNEITTSAHDKVLNRLAFYLSKARFTVKKGAESAVWIKTKGHWGPLTAGIQKKQVTLPHPMAVHTQRRLRVLPIVLMSLSAAFVAGGATLNYLANGVTDRINHEGVDLLQRRKGYVIAGWTAYGTAAALGISAVVLWSIKGTHDVHTSIMPGKISVYMGF